MTDIDLSINPGDAVSIMGPSGSGKSTLLNIIGTLNIPSTGKVMYDGKELTGFDDIQLASLRNNHIGFVFQMHHLLPQLSLIENVLVPVIAQKSKEKMIEAKKRASNLLEFVGLIDHIHQKPGQMSVGECQRTAVVRALINEPEFLLADEPTGSLDQESAEQIGELLKDINKKQNIATVIVSHSENLAKKMDRVYNLVNGKLEKQK